MFLGLFMKRGNLLIIHYNVSFVDISNVNGALISETLHWTQKNKEAGTEDEEKKGSVLLGIWENYRSR